MISSNTWTTKSNTVSGRKWIRTKHTTSGTDGQKGFIVHWVSESDSVGEGEQEITSITEGERVDFALRFIKPQEMESSAYMTTTNENGGTEVTWGFEFDVPYPFNIFMIGADMDSQLGPDLEYGLKKLKGILEQS